MLKFKALTLAVIAGANLTLAACTNPTGTSGQMSYFTEGTIKDIEVIDLQKNEYDTKKNAALGAIVGAAAGQLIGRDTEGTLIGAGIGAIVGGGASMAADSGTGMRLTVNTDSGLVLIDQPYSCLFKKNAKVRLINRDGSTQLQVYDGSRYRTATNDSPSDCPLN